MRGKSVILLVFHKWWRSLWKTDRRWGSGLERNRTGKGQTSTKLQQRSAGFGGNSLKCKQSQRRYTSRRGLRGILKGLESWGSFAWECSLPPLLLMLCIEHWQWGSRWAWWPGAGWERQGGVKGSFTLYSLSCLTFSLRERIHDWVQY